MTLRSPTEYEMEGPLHTVLPSTRHSRARGNPGLFPAVSLDTRFRGYDVTRIAFADRRGIYFQRRSLCVSA
jgi:hypothetical protein